MDPNITSIAERAIAGAITGAGLALLVGLFVIGKICFTWLLVALGRDATKGAEK